MRIARDELTERRAADWLARLDRGTAGEEIHCEFEAWCRDDQRNLATYLRLLEAWNRLDALEGKVRDFPLWTRLRL
jgi:ferric-dicitrate binding protein FerR (iron transport regulator)